MTIEIQLKRYIMAKHKSLRNFVNESKIDMPYSTVDGILKRGINKASIDNIIKICDALDISVDALAQGKIVPRGSAPLAIFLTEITDLIEYMRNTPEDFANFTIEDRYLSQDEADLLLDSLELTVDLIIRKRWRERDKYENS